jgi:hypothetical protein
MAFCRGCGKEIHETALTCPHCGAVVVKEASPATSSSPPIATPIITEAWQKVFDLLEKAGGPKQQKINELAFSERRRVVFNVWGFLFGPFYYLAKGMWKKAIVLFALCVVAVAIVSIICEAMGVSDFITYFISSAVFGTRANIDYYKKMVLGDDGWW